MDYRKAAAYWEEKDASGAGMDRESLLAEAEQFLAAHNTCALATGSGGFVRCTPIEYSYREGKFYLFSEGGQKFRALEKNRNVCLAVYDEYRGFANLAGMQVTGTASLVEPWSEEYLAQLAFQKLPEAALRALDHPMYLLRIAPARVDFLCSAFKARGFAPRQHLVLAAEAAGTDYGLLIDRLRALGEGETDRVPLYANAAALLFESLPDLSWAGFYRLCGETLVLGPFQGRPACVRIPLGKGVCGTAAREDRAVRVEDVHRFPGHIACDCASNSELVVPIHGGGTVSAVLDLDSPTAGRFTAADEAGLLAFARVLEEHPAR